MMRICIINILFLLWVGLSAAGASDGIVVEVTGGKTASSGRIIEQEFDLDAAGKLLGMTAKVDPGSVRVVELGPTGKALGTMVSQVDAVAGRAGSYIVCWHAAGELGAGQTRRFEIVLGGKGPVPVPARPVTARTDGNTTTVTSGDTELTYSKGYCGMLTGVKVGGISVGSVMGQLSMGERLYDGTKVYGLTANPVRLLASGPLRVVYEVEGVYAGSPSNARAVYRSTHYAGEPVARLTAKITQDYATPYELYFSQINFTNPPISHYTAGTKGGGLGRAGTWARGAGWAAVYGEGILLGLCGTPNPAVYSPPGSPPAGGYLASVVGNPFSTLSHSSQCVLYFGAGHKDLPGLADWNAIVSDTPALKVKLDVLDNQIARLSGLVEKQREQLSRLDGEDWAAAYVRTYISGNRLKGASAALGRGEFDIASGALDEAKSALESRAGDIRVVTQGTVLAGMADGYPFLLNSRAAYFWSRPEQGAGLMSIYDRRQKREFLNNAPAVASFWQASVKKGDVGKSYASNNTACRADPENGCLKFEWAGPFSVRVEARLTADESLLRLRLTASAETADEGILNITFPVVTGILPITAGAAGDVVLNTAGTLVGDLVPSPLVSGAQVRSGYPAGMQFTALQGDNTGLYFADEDPQANRKSISLSAESDAGSLVLTITRPVLGWGGKKPVKTYASSGDAVIGPFRGDWYDATQLYRKWALTAPWTAKGPIHARNNGSDIPKWLSDAIYFTVPNLRTSERVDLEIYRQSVLGPGGVAHVYNYYLSPTHDDLYPDLFPNRFGSEGFRKLIQGFHERGMRLFPYVNGFVWDEDSESYRTLHGEKGQVMRSDGSLNRGNSYGGGTWLAGMCPASKIWQDKLIDTCRQGVELGLDGWYFDFLTLQRRDCYNPEHGHPICGGNYWTKSVRELFGRIRRELKAINPDVMMTTEHCAEWVIDMLDTQYVNGASGTKAPLYQAVYHDYSLLYGGLENVNGPEVVGRWWLLGNQNGWHNMEGAYTMPESQGSSAELWRKEADYYRRQLRCHREFALPYLAYGRMLRMPRIATDLPETGSSQEDKHFKVPYTVPVVEGTAWQAPDGTVGIFFLNYGEEPQEFTWTMDLAEAVGWGAKDKLSLSQWMEDGSPQESEEINGGKLLRSVKLEGRGILAMKLEVTR